MTRQQEIASLLLSWLEGEPPIFRDWLREYGTNEFRWLLHRAVDQWYDTNAYTRDEKRYNTLSKTTIVRWLFQDVKKMTSWAPTRAGRISHQALVRTCQKVIEGQTE